LPAVVLISGKGTNLQAIIEAVQLHSLPLDIRAVLSNRPRAPGLGLAQQAGLATEIIDHTLFADRHSFDAALRTLIDHHQPGIVILAGFMRVLGHEFVEHYRGRLLNIHPSLLPLFPGLATHQRALSAGVKQHGASVHYVTPEIDGGPVILQGQVAVLEEDSVETLGARVLEQEHIIYPKALRWFAQGRLSLHRGQGKDYALLNGRKINQLTEQSRP
jgi:phosphoribosylglycinamide formyltransferase-1